MLMPELPPEWSRRSLADAAGSSFESAIAFAGLPPAHSVTSCRMWRGGRIRPSIPALRCSTLDCGTSTLPHHASCRASVLCCIASFPCGRFSARFLGKPMCRTPARILLLPVPWRRKYASSRTHARKIGGRIVFSRTLNPPPDATKSSAGDGLFSRSATRRGDFIDWTLPILSEARQSVSYDCISRPRHSIAGSPFVHRRATRYGLRAAFRPIVLTWHRGQRHLSHRKYYNGAPVRFSRSWQANPLPRWLRFRHARFAMLLDRGDLLAHLRPVIVAARRG